jgi:hypothetical protein
MLDQSDFADGGDTVRMSTTSDFNVDFSSTGANWTWDFSSLVAESQTLLDFTDMSSAPFIVNIIYGPFAAPEYQATYFMPNDDIPLDQAGGILPVNITDIFQYSKVDASKITSLGYAMSVDGTDIPFKSDTIETRYEFPMMYQNTYTSNGYTNMDLNPIQDIIWRQSRTRDVEVDGWGTMSTPYGTFQTLRVKHTITETDSIYIDLFGGPIWIPLPIPDSYIYEWWTNGEKEAILRIETSAFGGNEVVTGVEFRDDFDPSLASIKEEIVEVEVYPNPVVNELHIKGFDADTQYSIVDANGAVILQGRIDASQTVAVDALAKGQYMLLIYSKGSIGHSSFVKQ